MWQTIGLKGITSLRLWLCTAHVIVYSVPKLLDKHQLEGIKLISAVGHNFLFLELINQTMEITCLIWLLF